MKVSRPPSISVVGILFFVIGTSLAVRSIGQFVVVPGLYTFLMLVNSLLGLYAYWGLWNMKRWSIPLFLVVWAFIAVPIFLTHEGMSTISLLRSLYVFLLVTIFVVVVLPHRSRMSPGRVWNFKRSTE
jgi:uncharacterized membrane protein (DUF2068 family)